MADKKNDKKKAQDIIRSYGGYGGGKSEVVFDSRDASYRPKGADKEPSEAAKKTAEILNKTNQHAAHIQNNLGIWRDVNPGYRSNTSGQAALEGLMSLQNMGANDSLIVYDTETLGTTPNARKTGANMGFYTPTEIGFQHVKMVNGKLVRQEDSLSMLMRPTDDNQRNLNSLLNKAETGGWKGMTLDERRTLSDLMLYSGDSGKMFKTEDKSGRKVTTVNSQNRAVHPQKGSVLFSSENIAMMKNGLNNLVKHGTAPEDAILEMNSFMKTMSNVRMGGYNVFSFDQPMMMDYLNNQVGSKDPNSKVGKALQVLKEVNALQQVDTFHAARTLDRESHTNYGKNMRLESTMDASMGQAHHALSDVQATIDEMNRLLSNPGIQRTLKTGGTKGSKFGSFDPTPIETGNVLFGRKGLNTRDSGQYDGVFRKTNTGALEPAYDIKVNPLYRNTTYKVENFYDGVEMDGKKMYGVSLFNQEDDLHHVIMRESKAELQDVMHGHLDYIGDADRSADRNIQAQDRASRRYRKMFSTENGGGAQLGRKMMTALDIARAGEEAGLKQSAIRDNIIGADKYNSPELVRDFETMRPRLEAEEDWIRTFLNDVETTFGGDSTHHERSRDMAFSEFGRLMNHELGENTHNRAFTNDETGMMLKTGQGNDKVLRVGTDADSVRQSLYGHLYDKHAGKPHMANMKKDFRDLLYQLKSYDALSAKKYEEMYRAIGNYRTGESIDNLLSELANDVTRARDEIAKKGLKGLDVEDPTRLHGGRAANMGSQAFFEENFERIKKQALDKTQPFRTTWDGKSSTPLTLGGSATDLLAQHDKAIQNILDRNNISGTKLQTDRVRSSADSLSDMVTAYTNRGMNVQIRHDKERDALQMILAPKDVSDNALNGGIEDLRKNSKNVAVINLPKLNADGTISLGSQNRVSRLSMNPVDASRGGGYEVSTAFDEILGVIKGSAITVEDMLKNAQTLEQKNGMIQVQGHLNKKALKGIQSLSANNRFTNPSDKENMYEVRSQAANWVRTGHVDISKSAEDWYTKWYDAQTMERRKSLGLSDPKKIAEKAKANKDLFANQMGSNARHIFQREIDQYLKETTGMDLGMHSVKDVHASNYIRSNLDTRDLLAFGKYSPMARENLMKTTNYLALDRKESEDALRRGGYSKGKVKRMTSRGVMSTVAKQVMEEATTTDKLSFLNMRVAYMDDKQLEKRVTDARATFQGLHDNTSDAEEKKKYKGYLKQLNSERLSVYDGMMVMSEEAGEALATKRDKRITLKEGAEFTPEIKAMLDKATQGNFDPSQSVKDFHGLKLSQGLNADDYTGGKKLTISQIVKEKLDMMDADGEPIMEKSYIKDEAIDGWKINKMEFGSWDAEERVLTLRENAAFGNSTKVISEGGLRGTATSLAKDVMKEVVGADVDAIVPAFETSKKLYGTELQRLVGFAVDEALAMTEDGKVTTIGELSKDDALRKIDAMMRETFQIKDGMTRIEGDQLLIDSQLGHNEGDAKFNYTDVGRFANRLKDEMGIVAEVNGVNLGNLGMGRHDVFDWENGIGLVDEHRVGLVKYGRKEIDMVSERANQVLGKGSQVVGWLGDHIKAASKEQAPEMERVAKGLFRIGREDGKYAPKEGDVVVRTRSEMGPDANAIRNGIYNISMNEVNPLPEATIADMKFTTDHYAGTIIDPQGMRGQFSDGTSYGAAIDGANARYDQDGKVVESGSRSYLIEMPDDTFAKNYIRAVDFGDITKGGSVDTPMMRDLQKTQMQIWRGIKEYQAFGEKGQEVDDKEVARVRGRVNDLIYQYEDQAVKMTTNARDSGLMKSLGSAKMDMSGRFRVQGVNPYGNYEEAGAGEWQQKEKAQYKEGVAYMSRDRVSEMIKGAEVDIAKTMIQGLDKDEINKMGLGGNLDNLGEKQQGALHKKVLDNVNSRGLYGLVNRYPTIKQSTMQAMKIEIDGDMDANDRGARLTIGTAARLKADFDGDFMSTTLAHYGAGNTHDVGMLHKEMESLFKDEQGLSIEEGRHLMKGIDSDIGDIAKTMNVTVGDLAKDIDGIRIMGEGQRSKKQQSLLDLFNAQIKSRLQDTDTIETREARLGKEFVGGIDNTRDKVTTLATSTIEILQNNGRMDAATGKQYRNSIEDFMATFSQELISSKKFDIDKEIERQMEMDGDLKTNTEEARNRAKAAVNERYTKVLEMNEAMMNPTTDNLDIWRRNNDEIGLFTGEKDVHQMNETLERIRNVALWNGRSDGYNNFSLRLGVSEGVGADKNRNFVQGKGNQIVSTPMTRFQQQHMDTESAAVYSEGMANHERSVLQGYDDVAANGSKSLIDTMSDSAVSRHALDGATMSERASGSLRGMASQFMPSGGGGGAGIAGGAIAFGALWAGSAFARSGPTPEGLREQTREPIAAPVSSSQLAEPTARVTENNGEHINVRVSAKGAANMSEQEVASMVHQEISAMTTVNMNTTMNVNDNTQNIDQQWLQGIIANAMNKGIGF